MLTHEMLGARLKEARASSGYTQNEAAQHLGISRQKLINIEKGATPIDTLLLKKMADLYGYTLDYFFSGNEDEVDIKLAFRAVDDVDNEDQETINWARKIILNIKNLNEICEEIE